KDGGCGADTQGEGEDGDSRKPRTVSHHAKGVANVLADGFKQKHRRSPLAGAYPAGNIPATLCIAGQSALHNTSQIAAWNRGQAQETLLYAGLRPEFRFGFVGDEKRRRCRRVSPACASAEQRLCGGRADGGVEQFDGVEDGDATAGTLQR